MPDAGSTYILPRLVGLARAMELSLLGEKLPAEKALDWGLINRVYDDGALMGEAKAMATELANGPTVSLGLIRKLYWDSPENTFEQQLDLEFRTQRIAGQTADFKEGVKAQVDDSDSATHYDLGFAYKQMGLLQDAISELELAALAGDEGARPDLREARRDIDRRSDHAAG